MDGLARIRGITVPRQQHTPTPESVGEYGRGSFLGHGFRVARTDSTDVAHIEVYSNDRWWVMCRVEGLADTSLEFLWERAWRRVGQSWRTGVEAEVREILAGARNAA